jgi:hypothetical protein
MIEHEPGTDGYDTEDYGTGGRPGHGVTVVERTPGFQAPAARTSSCAGT